MNSELKARWVAALRSGEFAQNRWSFRFRDVDKDRTTHCCLSVLSMIAEMAVDSTDDFQRTTVGQSIPFAHWDKCIEMNDIDKLSFSQIADYIEKEL